MEFRHSDSRVINDKVRYFIESMAEEILSALSDSLIKTKLGVSRYLMFSLEQRAFLESRPFEIFHLHRKMDETVVSRKVLSEIMSLLDEYANVLSSGGSEAFFFRV